MELDINEKIILLNALRWDITTSEIDSPLRARKLDLLKRIKIEVF